MRVLTAVFLGLLLAAPASLCAQATGVTRFPDPDRITADPTGLRRDPTVHEFPHYPQGLRQSGVTGAPVVAFVIDTTGRVEVGTATFLNAPGEAFANAVCEMLPALRFLPFQVDHEKWRVLLVTSYAFNIWDVPDSLGGAASRSLVSRKQEEFATKPIRDVVAQLDTLPACDRLAR